MPIDFLSTDYSSNQEGILHYRSQTLGTISSTTIKVAESLKNIPRIWNSGESVWTHTMETIDLVKLYSDVIEQYHGLPHHIINLLLVHDIPEIITGDTDPRYIEASIKFMQEETAMLELIEDASDRTLWYEYTLGETINARFAKAFDKLQFLNNLIKLGEEKEYWGAMVRYRKFFEPFPELLRIVDHPVFPNSDQDFQKVA